TASKGIFGMFNLFSGGSVARVSIFALGIMPYITSSIIIQLVISSSPELKKARKEGGDQMQEKINQYTKLLTIFVGIAQGLGISSLLISAGVHDTSVMEFRFVCTITMLCGTFILIWLGDRISKNGIGNGSSLIIFTGIVAEAPRDFMNIFNMAKTGVISSVELATVVMMFCIVVAVVVMFEKSNRLVYIQYPKQMQQFAQNRNMMPNFMPIKVNPAGVMPPIFASSIILLPSTVANIFKSSDSSIVQFILSKLTHGTVYFIVFDIILIVFFSFFYNNIAFDADDIANQLRKNNIFIPGTRPGVATSELFKRIINRLSLIGACYLSFICALPELFGPKYGYSFILGGTGLLIVVNVITDTIAAVQAQMLPTKYQQSGRKVYK
ncbi:MAG: hypothetical protein RL208_152, partial [Pseudomonadota bacterium]